MKINISIIVILTVLCSCTPQKISEKSTNGQIERTCSVDEASEKQDEHILDIISLYSQCRPDYFKRIDNDSLICFNVGVDLVNGDTFLVVADCFEFVNYWAGISDNDEYQPIHPSVLSRKYKNYHINIYPSDSTLQSFSEFYWGVSSIDLKEAEAIQKENEEKHGYPDPQHCYTFKLSEDSLFFVREGFPDYN